VTLQVELVSPERILYSGQADMVIARTVGGGDIAFLTGHAPFVGALDIATLTIRSSGEGDKLVAVHGGFVEVSGSSGSGSGASGAGGDGAGGAAPETTVTILSDVAELSDQIDVDRARQAQQQAEERLRGEDDAEAQAALQRAHVRLQVAGAETP
jgi:F-type H+-transporting ATPase subunit epsilon